LDGFSEAEEEEDVDVEEEPAIVRLSPRPATRPRHFILALLSMGRDVLVFGAVSALVKRFQETSPPSVPSLPDYDSSLPPFPSHKQAGLEGFSALVAVVSNMFLTVHSFAIIIHDTSDPRLLFSIKPDTHRLINHNT
jgi:hypothetical protein